MYATKMCVCVLRLLQEQMEQSLSDVQHRLSVKTSEVQAAHQKIERLEERISECYSITDLSSVCYLSFEFFFGC